MFQAVQRTMIRRRSPSSRASVRTARSSTPRMTRATRRLAWRAVGRREMRGHGTRCLARVTARALEGDDQRRPDPRDGLPAAARRDPRRQPEEDAAAHACRPGACRRPARRGAGVRDLHAALGLDAAARAARQPLPDPLAARAAPALRLRQLRPEVVGALDGRARPRHQGRRVPAVGPPAAARARRQREVDHRGQDAQQRLHRRPPARVLAGRALHLPAAPPRGDRALAAGVQGPSRPTRTTRTPSSSAATARRSRPRGRPTTATPSATRT